MGAKLHGLRGPLNDNKGRYTGPLDEIPIDPEDFRHAPVIEKDPDRFWFCLVTVPQGEFRCADRLGEADPAVATYVPTDTHWSRRRKVRDWLKVQTQSPIFRGYVFAKLTKPKLVDRGGGPELACGEDWRPILERDKFRQSPHGIIGVISYHGVPLPMPLRRSEMRDGEVVRTGIADFADDEREGWFDDRKRPALLAARDAKPVPQILKGEEVQPRVGPFSGQTVIADNDNDERGYVKLRSQLFGGAATFVMHLDDLANLTRPQNNAAEGLRRA